jgi:hypothetical protein
MSSGSKTWIAATLQTLRAGNAICARSKNEGTGPRMPGWLGALVSVQRKQAYSAFFTGMVSLAMFS